MAQLSYISIRQAVSEFADDIGLGHDEIDEPLFIKWATDCISWFNVDKELTNRLVVLQVENSRAKLPDDFKMLVAAAGRIKEHHQPRSTREQIVQWTQDTFDKDCQLEINLVCKRCHKTKCECDTPIVEVKIDDIWRQAHPEAFYKGFDRVGRFGYGPGKNGVNKHHNEFQLMRYSTSNFFNYKNVIAQCPNVDCNSNLNFIINIPWIEVDWRGKGEILLSYLGRQLDENGDLMIPNHADALSAVTAHIKHKYYYILGAKKKDQFYINLSNMAKKEREEHIALYKASDFPTYHEFKSYLEDSSMLKRIPLWSDDYNGKIPDLYDSYLED